MEIVVFLLAIKKSSTTLLLSINIIKMINLF